MSLWKWTEGKALPWGGALIWGPPFFGSLRASLLFFESKSEEETQVGFKEGVESDRRCEACGRLYGVTYQQFPSRDRGEAHCDCGALLDRWKGTRDYTFTLKGTWPDSSPRQVSIVSKDEASVEVLVPEVRSEDGSVLFSGGRVRVRRGQVLGGLTFDDLCSSGNPQLREPITEDDLS